MYFTNSWPFHKRFLCLMLFLGMVFNTQGQKIIHQSLAAAGKIQLSADISIPKINPGYTLWLPEDTPAKGLIVFTHPRVDSISDPFIDYSLSKGLAVLYAWTDNRLEFFFETEKMLQIERFIYAALDQNQIPFEHLFFCGMSLEGTRALKLAYFASSPKARYHLKARGIAICDAPLDMVRFHRTCERAEAINFQAAAANEGKWVSAYLETNLKGTPSGNMQTYMDYSPYCYSRPDQTYLKTLQETPIRAYTEPDVDWWMQTRRKSYYDMNSLDLAALINELNILGNQQAQLIISQEKGFHPDGTRHPHSWSIVDEKDLINWFVSLIKP